MSNMVGKAGGVPTSCCVPGVFTTIYGFQRIKNLFLKVVGFVKK